MISGSALLRVFLLLVAAAVLAGIVQRYLPQDDMSVASATTAPSTVVKRPEAANRPPAASVAEAPSRPAPEVVAPANGAGIDSEPFKAEATANTTAATRQIAAIPAPPPPQQPAPVAPEPESEPATLLPQEPTGGDASQAAIAADSSDPRAVDLVDLNTGSLSDLNGLRGGGTIGRAIMQRRPYASIDQLLSKRVLSRSVYQRIKDQVTVR